MNFDDDTHIDFPKKGLEDHLWVLLLRYVPVELLFALVPLDRVQVVILEVVLASHLDR